MAEILFVLVTIYTVYVVHSAVNKKLAKKTTPIIAEPKPPKAKQAIKKETKTVAKPKPTVKKQKPTSNKTPPVKKKVPAKKTPTAKKKSAVPEGSLRNPETGEVDKIASSYRMLKRWMKEALVEEKLLEKIYKTNEIDDATKEKINNALEKLKKMDNYQ